MKAVAFTGAGGNEVVEVVERPDPIVGPDDVLLAVTVAGMNPADLEQREGRYPAPRGVVPDVPGLEVAGSVLAAGERVTSWSPGDRVFGLVGGGGLASRVVVHERCVTRVPELLGPDQAAAVPEAFITAHDALRQCRLRPGETVLVHGATGAVGSAAVGIACVSGARVIAPIGSSEGAEAVASIGAEPVDDRAEAIASAAGPRGVDVVVELVGGASVKTALDVLAVGGRIVVISVAGGSTAELDLLRLMVRRATIRGTVLRARPLDEKAAAVQAFAREVVPMLADGRLAPSIDSVFDIGDVRAAFGRLAERGKRGKVLVRFP
ncbi:MAG TPA: zinc-binding dehydrogenase [Actinomycetota bacterium]|nr:zinc-binding dehydrogenase [Actinomycetota bacterium]